MPRHAAAGEREDVSRLRLNVMMSKVQVVEAPGVTHIRYRWRNGTKSA
jgi:hypothetical protein